MKCYYCKKDTQDYVLIAEAKSMNKGQQRKKVGWCFKCREKKSELHICQKIFPHSKSIININYLNGIYYYKPLTKRQLLPSYESSRINGVR